MSTSATEGIHHLGLTVPNLEESKRFFLDVLGFEQVGEKPAYPAVFVSDGSVMLTLWQADEPAQATAFDRKKNIGLHHFALRLKSPEALESLHQTLVDRQDVAVEFAPEALGTAGARHMMCAIPGGIRVEFIALP